MLTRLPLRRSIIVRIIKYVLGYHWAQSNHAQTFISATESLAGVVLESVLLQEGISFDLSYHINFIIRIWVFHLSEVIIDFFYSQLLIVVNIIVIGSIINWKILFGIESVIRCRTAKNIWFFMGAELIIFTGWINIIWIWLVIVFIIGFLDHNVVAESEVAVDVYNENSNYEERYILIYLK